MGNGLDDFLNVAIPVILVLIVIGFAWVKFIQPWVVPMLVKLWEWISTTNQDRRERRDAKREIVYE